LILAELIGIGGVDGILFLPKLRRTTIIVTC
jgi:hypothetical protein